MIKRLSLTLSAAAVASVLLLAGCSGTPTTTESGAAAETSAPSETSKPSENAAPADQTVAEACTFAGTSMTNAIAALTPVPESLAAGKYAEASDTMNTLLEELDTIKSEIGNAEVQSAFGKLVDAFAGLTPIIDEMEANADNPEKIAELQAEYQAAGTEGEDPSAELGELCSVTE